MVIIHVMGGLGNQLYQYAMYEKLKSLGKTVKLDLYAYTEAIGEDKEWRELELRRFEGMCFDICTKKERTEFLDNRRKFWDRIRRKLCGRQDRTVRENAEYMPEIFDMDNVYLYGFWGCERYYQDILPQLREKIIFPISENMEIAKRNVDCMEQMATENAVSIHVRRSDYLSVAGGARYMGICTEAYYQKAMQYVENRVADPVYYIFSDDINYVKSQFKGKNIHIVDWNLGKDSLFDMQLMSKCRHHICANSTFSMWGAMLNPREDKLMLRPLRHDNYEKTAVAEVQQNWNDWILLDKDGNVCEEK